MKEDDIDALAQSLIKDVIELIHCRLFSHNKSVSKGDGGDYINIEEGMQSAMYRLKEALVDIALDN